MKYKPHEQVTFSFFEEKNNMKSPDHEQTDKLLVVSAERKKVLLFLPGGRRQLGIRMVDIYFRVRQNVFVFFRVFVDLGN